METSSERKIKGNLIIAGGKRKKEKVGEKRRKKDKKGSANYPKRMSKKRLQNNKEWERGKKEI